MIELACSAHALAVDSALFAGPVVMLSAALWIAARRDRRREQAVPTAHDAQALLAKK
jgi:succinate dehydrogenase/fumarate reductase-like Fe-S protein